MSSEHREKAVEAARIAFEASRVKPTELAIDDALQAAEPHLQRMFLERFGETAVTHVGEWALGLLKRGEGEVTTDDWAELRQLLGITTPPDTDDLCTCGHARHEHHTWNENASVGCAYCACEQFHLDLAALDKPEADDG